MKKILNIILLLASCTAWSQTPDPQVINSAGEHRVSATGISITDNVGEPFTQTLGPLNQIMITEGFLQPLIVSPGFSVTLAKSDVTCSDKKDGSVNIEIGSVYTQTTASYYWTPSSICPGNNCGSIDSLAPGNYSVAVKITYTTTAGFVNTDSTFHSLTINDAGAPCKITIYSGFVPGDNGGSKWTIGNIELYKSSNKVSIFNRWGKEIYSTSGYDNNYNAWTADEKLPASTYFYIIDLGDGSKPYKGWVELIKN